MIRVALIDLLQNAAPALAKTTFFAAWANFSFTGKRLFTYNDQIGFAAACNTEFKGGVRGDVFLSMLKQMSAREISLEKADNDLMIVAGRSKVKLGLDPLDEMAWKPPAPSGDGIKLAAKHKRALLRALRMVLCSVNSDSTHPDTMGVTFIPSKSDKVTLYATNNHSISEAVVKLPSAWPSRVILPTAFCEHFLTLATASPNEDITIDVASEHVVAFIGGMVLFTRVIDSERPYDFAGSIAKAVEGVNKFSKIPPQLQLVLERSCIIAGPKADTIPTHFSVDDDGMCTMLTQSDLGECKERIKLLGHSAAEGHFSAAVIKAGIGSYYSSVAEDNGELLISARGLALRSGDCLFVASPTAGHKKKKAKADKADKADK